MAHERKNATASGFLLLSHTLFPTFIYLLIFLTLPLCNVVQLLSVQMFGKGFTLSSDRRNLRQGE